MTPSERDALIVAFQDRDPQPSDLDDAWQLVDQLGKCVKANGSPCWVTDFKRRIGAHPNLDGWPMVEFSTGVKCVLNPAHETASPNGRSAVTRGLISLEASNGR
jgi:hypothetical protein